MKRNLNDLKRLSKGKGQIGLDSVINSRADVDGILFEHANGDQSDCSTEVPSDDNHVSVSLCLFVCLWLYFYCRFTQLLY